MRVLIVKTSSLGDIIHTFPALTDAARAAPGIAFDWVAEAGLAEACRWHPAVADIVTVDYRYWRRRMLRGLIGGALAGFRRRLRARRYDAIIDAQGLYKSGFITAMADGPAHGYDLFSCREKLAPLAYDHRYRIARELHAIRRARLLFAAALGYEAPQSAPDFGLDPARLAPTLEKKRIVLLHSTDRRWRTKFWPLDHWREAAALALAAGLEPCLPWQAERDRVRAEAIAGAVPGAVAIETPTLDRVAGLIASASGVIALDTGLGQLAAAFGVPTVSLYGPTGTERTGTIGARATPLSAGKGCAPCRNKICNYTGNARRPSPCMAALTARRVWQALDRAMATG